MCKRAAGLDQLRPARNQTKWEVGSWRQLAKEPNLVRKAVAGSRHWVPRNCLGADNNSICSRRGDESILGPRIEMSYWSIGLLASWFSATATSTCIRTQALEIGNAMFIIRWWHASLVQPPAIPALQRSYNAATVVTNYQRTKNTGTAACSITVRYAVAGTRPRKPRKTQSDRI